MKKTFAWVLIFGLGCQQAEQDVNPELLYRNWNLILSSAGGVGGKNLVEFTRQSTLLYGPTKTDGGCCSPHNFTAESGGIQFTTLRTPPDICTLISCGQSELISRVMWRIEKLDKNQLVLKLAGRELLFEAEP